MVRRAGLVDDDACRFWRIFDLLTRESLDFARTAALRRFSGICRDGTPWQFCVAMGSQSASLRFLTEVGSPASLLRERTRLTLTRMIDLFALIGAADQAETAEVLAELTPPDDDHIAGLWVGVAVTGHGAPRVRLYANNGWGDATERWLRLIRALRQLNAGGFGAMLQPLLPLLVPAFSPNGFAVTVPASRPVCKLYLRPTMRPWGTVRALAGAVLAHHADALIGAIEDGLGQPLESLPDRALVVSMAGFASGEALDLKLDLCGHCIFTDDSQATRAIDRLGQSLGLDPSPYHAAVEDLGWSGKRLPKEMVAFLGVGGTANGGDRINVYLTPPTLAHAA
jgi:hypothetical protein